MPYRTEPYWFTAKQDIPLHIYVRAVDGDDNNPGTIESPIATLTEAERRVPIVVNRTVFIHVGAHTGDGYISPTFVQRSLRKNIYVICDGAGVGDGFTEVLSQTSAGAGSDDSVVISSAMTENAFRGKTIEILSGLARGDKRTIRNNTTTQIYPILPFTDDVSDGDLFRIVEPNVVIQQVPGYPLHHYSVLASGIGGGPAAEPHGPPSYQSHKIYIVNAIMWCNAFKFIGSSICFYGTRFINNSQMNFSGSSVSCGFDYDPYDGGLPRSIGPYEDFDLDSEHSWSGWGSCFEGLVCLGDKGSTLHGYFVVKGYAAVWDMNVVLMGGAITDGAILDSQAYAIIASTSSIPIQLIGDPCVLVRDRSYLSIGGGVELSGSGDGIVCRDNGFAFPGGISGNVDGIGSRTVHGGTIRWHGVPGLTGTTGDFSEDNGATLRAASALSSNGTNFVNSVDLSRIYRNDFP